MMENKIICDECGFEFDEDSIIYMCRECGMVLCEECKEEHNCICDEDDYDWHTNETCIECGVCEEEMYVCPYCNEIVCGNCINEHSKNHKDELVFDEYGYEEFIKDKIIDCLKD